MLLSRPSLGLSYSQRKRCASNISREHPRDSNQGVAVAVGRGVGVSVGRAVGAGVSSVAVGQVVAVGCTVVVGRAVDVGIVVAAGLAVCRAGTGGSAESDEGAELPGSQPLAAATSRTRASVVTATNAPIPAPSPSARRSCPAITAARLAAS